jgi:HK97 family phage prohead protease
MDQLPMELRSVQATRREVTGRLIPYGEVSYLTPDPGGERVMPGAFTRSIAGRKVPLFRAHDHASKLGTSTRFTETADGLEGVFAIVPGRRGDELIDDVRNGVLAAMSVGFKAMRTTRGADGVREVREAQLVEVSLVGLPAYAGAEGLALRHAHLGAATVRRGREPWETPRRWH